MTDPTLSRDGTDLMTRKFELNNANGPFPLTLR
jgi:hypothetical protein